MKMKNNEFKRDIFEGNHGKVLLELSKTYKGDERFKLDDRFKDDIQIQKLPEKFKQIAENGIIEKIADKKKKIKKDKPLIVSRFEPGTVKAEKIIKKAEGIKKYQQGLKRHEQKIKKKVANIQTGVDKIKKAEHILAQSEKEVEQKQSKFQVIVKGNRKQAFQANQFKLFG